MDVDETVEITSIFDVSFAKILAFIYLGLITLSMLDCCVVKILHD